MSGISARTLPRAEDRRRIAALLERGWSLPRRGEHALGALQGRALGGFRLMVLLGPKNAVGARYFQLFLRSAQGHLSDEALLLGLHNSGPFPAYNWIDVIRYEGTVTFGEETVSLADGGRERRLFRLLADLIPPGGHLMVEYESPYHWPTERLLAQGVPPVATPLGYAIFLSGCGASFRDWYISEGGREGPRKLQGFKPLDAEDAARKARTMADELQAYLATPAAGTHHSRRLARRVLRAIARSSVGAPREAPSGGQGGPLLRLPAISPFYSPACLLRPHPLQPEITLLAFRSGLAIGLGSYWPSVMIPCMSSTLSRLLTSVRPGK